MRKRDIAVLCALAMLHMKHHARAVDVSDIYVEGFAESESAGVEAPEVCFVVQGTDGADDGMDLVDAQDIGKFSPSLGTNQWERRTFQGMSEEEHDCGVDDLHGVRSELLVILQVEQIVSNLLLVELIRRAAVELGELPYGAQVSLLGALATAPELQLAQHALA